MKDLGRVVPRVYLGEMTAPRTTGVIETSHYINQTSDMLYGRNRQGILLPIEPKHHNLVSTKDTTGLILSKNWQVNGFRAADEFYNAMLHDASISSEVRKVVRESGIKRTVSGYSLTVNYVLTLEELKSASEVYVDGFDLLVSDHRSTLGVHPYSCVNRAALIDGDRNSGTFVTSIKIISCKESQVYWLACPNGAFAIASAHEPWWDHDMVEVSHLSSTSGNTPSNDVYTLDEALKGRLKLFRTREEAMLFLNGDTNKAELVKAETELKQLKIEQAAKDAELANARAKLEHEAKLETLSYERKNTQQKGVVETLKLVPIVGTIFTMISGLISLFV